MVWVFTSVMRRSVLLQAVVTWLWVLLPDVEWCSKLALAYSSLPTNSLQLVPGENTSHIFPTSSSSFWTKRSGISVFNDELEIQIIFCQIFNSGFCVCYSVDIFGVKHHLWCHLFLLSKFRRQIVQSTRLEKIVYDIQVRCPKTRHLVCISCKIFFSLFGESLIISIAKKNTHFWLYKCVTLCK